MRKRSLFLAGTVLVLTLTAYAAPTMQPLNIAKDCSEYTGDTPSYCTITASNVAAIPVGTKIFYYGPVTANPLFTSSSVIISVGNESTAVGYCVVYDSRTPPLGTCAFHAGSGTLAGFQAVLTATVDAKQIWHWEGGYLLGAAK